MRNEWRPITHSTLELAECRDKWTFDEQHGCWCLEDVLYTARADVPEFQRLSIFAPKALMNADGTPTRESKRIPVIFENSSAGYMQMPHTRLGESRCFAAPYLNHGFVYITCGCRGRESRGAQGELVGKAPMTLVDLKAAIRFLRHNQAALPGDFGKIISVGCSAGGAMSALLGVTGDNKSYEPYLKATGAFMEESDAVFASQIYCPITDLEHADLAYEWCFGADKECMDSHAGPAETMTPFKEALSKKLAARYVDYVNALGLRHPQTDAALTLNPDGHSGSFYDYMMDCISRSATDFLTRLQARSLPLPYSAEDYVSGQRAWLRWDGNNAVIDDLDAYVLHHRRRMKPCTSFDTLGMDSGENQVLGSANQDYMHFNPAIGAAIDEADQQKFRARRGQQSDENALQSSLVTLMRMLHAHYGEQVILLIDEYDVPLDKAHVNGYHDQMVAFLRGFFGEAFKTNPDLYFAVVTGCLRILKESIFTGINNLKADTITDTRYDEYFGFTEEDVKKLLADYGMEYALEDMQAWDDVGCGQPL